MDDIPTGPPPQTTETPEGSGALKKKKSKVRNAWISFVGRIVAQVIGAVASIVLAVMFLQRTQSNDAAPTAPSSPAASRAAARSAPRRADGPITLAVLPTPVTLSRATLLTG